MTASTQATPASPAERGRTAGRRRRRARRALAEPGRRLHDLPAALPLPHHRPAARSRPRPTRCAAPWCTRCSRTSSTCPRPTAPPSRAARPAGADLGRRCSRPSPTLADDVRADEGPERRREWLALLPRRSLDRYFTLEDPRRLEPAERELYVEALLDSKLLLRGFVDRLDVAPDGAIRVVDYKTGRGARRDVRGQGAVPDEVLRAGHLAHPRRGPGDAPAGLPRQRRDAALRARRGRPARHRAQGRGDLARRSGCAEETGDWRPNRSPALRLVRPPGALPRVGRHPAAAARPAEPASS